MDLDSSLMSSTSSGGLVGLGGLPMAISPGASSGGGIFRRRSSSRLDALRHHQQQQQQASERDYLLAGGGGRRPRRGWQAGGRGAAIDECDAACEWMVVAVICERMGGI